LLNELESLKERLKELETADLEQKKVIEALSESESKYRLLFDAAPVGIGIADLKGNIIDANRNMQEMSGFSLEEYRAIGVGATYADPEECMILLKALREKGKVRGWEGRLKRKDGSQYHALLNADIMELGGRKVLLGIIRDISERKRIEVALNAALTNAGDEKNKSEAIIAALGDGIIIQDTNYKIIYQNQVQNDIYGNRTGELCYRTYEGRDKICEDCPVEKTFLDGKIHRSERKFVTDKGVSYFELTSSPLRDSYGKIIAGIKVVRDITGSKRIEQTLRESEEKYRRLVETLMEGIWVLDKDANTTFVNPRMAQMLGYTVDEMLGKHLFSFMDEQGRMNATRYLERRQQNIKERHDFEFIRKDGTKIYTSLETSPITDENGNFSGAVAAIADITERKQAEAAIRESEELLHQAVRVSHIGIFDHDHRTDSIYWSPEQRHIYGLGHEEPVTLSAFLKYVYPEDRERITEAVRRAHDPAGDGSFDVEHRIVDRNGSIHWLSTRSRTHFEGEGSSRHPVRTVGAVVDITERKRAEKEKDRLLKAIDSSTDGITIADEKDRYIYVNAAYAKTFGYAQEELVGKTWREVTPPLLIAPIEKGLSSTMHNRDIGVFNGEVPGLRKDGTEIPTEVRGTALWGGNGNYEGHICIVRDITERKKVEEKIMLLSEAVEGAPDGVIIVDLNGLIIYSNRAVEDIYGFSPDDLNGKHVGELNVDPEFTRRVMIPDIKTKGRWVGELKVKKKNGQEFPIWLTASIVKDSNGEPIALVGVIRDITERKHIEQVLLENEERYRSFFEDSPISLWEEDSSDIKKYIDNLKSKGIKNLRAYFDRHPKEIALCASMMKVIDVNKATINLFKAKSKGDFIDGLEKIFTESSYETFKDELIAMSEGKTSYESEDIVKTLTGDTIHISLKWVLTPGNEKTYSKRLVSIIDITERKSAEEELNQRAQLAMLGAEVGIALTQGDTLPRILQRCTEALVQYLDAAFARIWTFNQAQNVLDLQASAGIYTHIDGSHSRIPLGSFKIGFIAKERKPHLTNSVIGDPRIHDQEWAKQEGMVAFAGYPLIVEDRLVGVVAMFARQPLSDFALKALSSVADSIALGIEHKQVEDAMKRYAMELEESNRMKELFADIMHHDLLNPLNTANGFIELLKETETISMKKAYLETIERSLVKGMELIDSAMKYSKFESLESIELDELDLKMVIGEAIENLTPLAVKAGMSIENNILDNMPANANKIIEDIFTNLISNAIKHAQKGKRIVVDSKDEGNFWLIRVLDFGAGIKDANKKLIFERFQREEKKGVKGSGLGLAIVRKIVELHNGRVWVEDNPEGGAIFIVEIPKS
jgi:PAS domain S-box-containing protein